MPKAQPHFDAEALAGHVHAQDFGLHVSVNDVEGFRRIMYAVGHAKPELKLHIYTSKHSKRRLTLLKAALPNHAALEEPSDDES